jgi:hypothetical protein
LLPATFLAVAIVAISAPSATAALPDTQNPTWQLDRTIRTTPFAGSSVSMRDNEGSAYVPSDDSLWLADDNGKAVYEIDPSTGAWKRTITRATFNAAVQLGGGPEAGTARTNDFESIAYDLANDTLYVFSGPCCDSSILPAVFRLTRDGSGALQVDAYQPLPRTFDFTAAAWNPADGKVYVGHAQQLRTYDFATNVAGSTFSVPGLAGITGMDFTPNGSDLFVTTSAERLMRVRWSTMSLVDSWTLSMGSFDVLDSRAVSLIDDRFFVSDGAGRTTGNPLRFAVFVFSVAGTSEPPPPTDNLVGNPGFETDTAGWGVAGSGSGVTLSRVEPGRDGSAGAAHLLNGSTGNRKCVLSDVPDWIASTSVGTYTASVWVRGEVAGATLRIKISEMNGSSLVKSRAKAVTLTTSWTQVSVAHTIVSPGSSLNLEVFVPRAYAPPGTCFVADDAAIIKA